MTYTYPIIDRGFEDRPQGRVVYITVACLRDGEEVDRRDVSALVVDLPPDAADVQATMQQRVENVRKALRAKWEPTDLERTIDLSGIS